MPEVKMGGQDLKQLAEQKESEWRELQQLRMQELESSLEQKDHELSEQRMMFIKLKEDFKYNLKLLNERHAELDNYDRLVLELRASLSAKDGELSNTKIRLDELQTASGREAASREEMGHHYQHRMREKQSELQAYRAMKDTELREERERLEVLRRTLEQRVLSLEDELATQQQELSHGFDEAMRQREHEYRKQMDTMNTTVLAHELKVKLLTKELEVVRAAAEKTTAVVSEADSHQRSLHKQLKHAQWELHDVSAMKDARISELEGNVEQMKKSMKRMQEDFAKRHEELDRVLRERESCLSTVKEAAHVTELRLSRRLQELEALVEDADLKVKEVDWSLADLRKDKDSVIQRLQLELGDIQTKCELRMSESSKDTAARDLELQRLREAEVKLKAELSQRKEDIERYKRELSAAIERQSDLDRAKAQLDLDWTHRCDDLERQQYERSEELVKGLTRSRDEAQAEVAEKDRELNHCKELIKVLTADRNQAIASLKQHGMPLDHMLQVDHPPLTDGGRVEELLVQNENLRAVVREMRKEMESLGDEIPAKPYPTADRREANLVANEYVKNLEKEVQGLKAKLRKAQHDAKHAGKAVNAEVDCGAALAAVGDNEVIRAHVEALNSAIGSLRSEKTDLMAQLRKQQMRIAHLESGLAQLSKQPLQKQATIEQLQYELSSQQRRHQVEVAGLKARLADLDLQLAETRKEADEFYKASIERNLETTALSNEISKLKMALAEKRPTINYGAQELVIQQLHDEMARLRRGPGGGPPVDGPGDPHGVPGPQRWAEAPGGLREKLRQAARHISHLAREKKQLIEMGNRLRAQLYKAGLEAGDKAEPSYLPIGPLSYVPAGPPPPTSGYSVTTSGYTGPASSQLQTTVEETTATSGGISAVGLSEKMKNKLIELERLQYELTKKNLAGEQRNQFLASGETETLSASLGSRSGSGSGSGSVSLGPLGAEDEGGEAEVADDNEEYRPPSILKKSSHDLPVKLSPVPENAVPASRQPALPTDIPRPDSALSDTFRPSTSHSARALPGMLSMSSLGGESLAEVWKLLDEEGISPRPFTPLHSGDGPFRGLQYPGDAYARSGSSQSLTLHGSQPQLQPRPHPQSKPAVNQSVAQRKMGDKKKGGPRPKIRNYNVKDEG